MREWDGRLVSPRHRGRWPRWPRPPHFVLAATVLVVLLLCLPLSSQHANASTASAPAASAPAASAPATSLLAPPSEGLRLARHLIVVACHAVYTAEDHGHDTLQRETSWFLEPFQHGQLETMLEHIKRGVELAAAGHLFFAHPPISPICRTPLFHISHILICFFRQSHMTQI